MLRLVRLSIVTAAAAVVLILLGGITRGSASGVGCENDWPLCQGRPYPPLDAMAIVEYVHRTSAVLVALLVALTAIVAWRTAEARVRTKLAATASAGLIAIQGALGAVEARWNVPAGAATVHLVLAMLFFAATLLAAVLAAA